MVDKTNSYLGTTRDGYNVYDRTDSHFHPEEGITKELLKNGISRMYADNLPFKKKEIKFPRPIGYNTCVKITPEDDVIMVYRKGREGKTPMVKGRKPELSNILTIIIRRSREEAKNYILLTAYVGGGSTREPWDRTIRSEDERKQCEEYWSNHALIYNPNLIDESRM